MLQNMEAEKTLIGLALTDLMCADRFCELPDETFSYAETIEGAKVIKSVVKKHRNIDLVTACNQLPPEAIAVKQMFIESIGLAISPTMYGHYEAICLDLRRRRKMRQACMKVSSRVEDPLEETDKLIGELQSAIKDTGGQLESEDMGTMVLDYLDDLGKKSEAIYTGIAGFDRLVGGLQPGMLVVLGARPGIGKTALALSVAKFVSQKTGAVLLNSLEMNQREIMARLMAAETGIDLNKLTSKKLDENEWVTVSEKAGELSQLPIRYVKATTVNQIRREAVNMKLNGGLAMIMVDYIQLMRDDEQGKSRYEQVSNISRNLKLLAMELDIPILALTQFNRESEAGGVKRRPTMAEAKDSGSIEQDANVFLIQYAPGEPKDTRSKHYPYWAACEERGHEYQILEVAKNRQGRCGEIPLEFDKPIMKFSTLTE